MTDSAQNRDMTPEEQFRILFDRTAKLNDIASALLDPEWGARAGIIPAGHPLHPGVETPAADEEQMLRWARRESLLVLLTRLQRGRPLTEDEARALRHHVDTEIREADTARTRAGQAGQRLGRIRNMVDSWERRLPDTIRTATAAEAVRLAVAGDDRPVMFGMQPDAELRAELEQAQATIERVRRLTVGIAQTTAAGISDYDIGRHELAVEVYTALDGAEPTMEQPSYSVLRAAYDESWQLIEMQKEFLGSLRRTILTATSDREDAQVTAERCEYCGRDHMAELYDAIVAADERYAERFPATADGPARPGRLPEQRTPEA